MSTSTVDIKRQPISFWYESISTVDFDRFLGEIRSIKYRPYFQIGESLSTVDIVRILK